MSDRALRIGLPVLVLALVLLAWDLAVRVFAIQPFVLPGPGLVLRTLIADGGLLWHSLLITLATTFEGFVLAAIGGIGLAVLFSQSRLIEYSLYPYAVMLQVTPVVAIAPLLLIYLPQPLAVLACAWIVAFFPVLANTTLGLASVDHNLLALFELYKASRWQMLWNLKLPSALPQILAGLRIAGGLSLIGAVVAEIAAGSAGAGSGLAYRIAESGYRLNIPRMFAALLLLSLAGIAIFFALSALSIISACAAGTKAQLGASIDHNTYCVIAPSAAIDTMTSIRPRCRPNASTAAIAASTAARISSASRSNAYQRSGPPCISVTLPNNTCSANQTDRLRITPTTAAVMAASAPASFRLPRNSSMNGAPAKIHSIEGTNVTHVVNAAPSTPAVSGVNGAASRKAARKPTNCVTRISGPGVVSARPSASTISGAVNQPLVSTACCAM